MDIVSAYNGKKKVREDFCEINDSLYVSSLNARFLSGAMPQITGFVSNISYVVVCIMGSMLILAGDISYGVVTAFIIYVKEFSAPLEHMSSSISNLQTVAASAERVFEILDAPEMGDESGKADMPENIEGRVEFDGVRFSYEEGKEIIHGLSLTVEPGQKIAIVGPTGSGKTTIANLLMRFYETDSGDIRIDGISLPDTRDVLHGPAGRLAVQRHHQGEHRFQQRRDPGGAGGGLRSGRDKNLCGVPSDGI